LLTISQPLSNHNGGWLGFGPDGYLYISTGDGGGGNDPGPGIGNAQNLNVLLGKMLRIDPLGKNSSNGQYGIPASNPFVDVTGMDEIWAYGLRNPWRASFDTQTGDLYIADVGQGQREEIDVQPASSTGGENYGWKNHEGTLNLLGPPVAGAIDPIHDYAWGLGGPFASVTGGYVYRGQLSQIKGHYFFADYVKDRIWSLKWDGSDPSTFNGSNFTSLIEWTGVITTDVGTIGDVSSFAEDDAGNLYIFDLSGEIFRIDTAIITAVVLGDANGDGVFSNLDIASFVLALTDPTAYQAKFPDMDPDLVLDMNQDGVFDNLDIAEFVAALTGP
jgi:hypothetical protein